MRRLIRLFAAVVLIGCFLGFLFAAPALAQRPGQGPPPPGGGAGGCAACGGCWLVMILIFFVVPLAVSGLMIAGMWKAFDKAGEEGWKAIVPVYNMMVMAKIAGREETYGLLCLIPIAGVVFVIIITIDFCKKFDVGGGFVAGIILLPAIFWPMLGFGSARYIGRRGRRREIEYEDEDEDDALGPGAGAARRMKTKIVSGEGAAVTTEAPAKEHDPMRSLWKRVRYVLTRPDTWVVLNGALAVLVVLDTFRSPSAQVTGWGYTCAVRGYQVVGRPVLKGRVQCRYCPSCSDYSIGAVQAHGVRRGLVLTWRRVSSCQANVPLGTPDPVPPPED